MSDPRNAGWQADLRRRIQEVKDEVCNLQHTKDWTFYNPEALRTKILSAIEEELKVLDTDEPQSVWIQIARCIVDRIKSEQEEYDGGIGAAVLAQEARDAQTIHANILNIILPETAQKKKQSQGIK